MKVKLAVLPLVLILVVSLIVFSLHKPVLISSLPDAIRFGGLSDRELSGEEQENEAEFNEGRARHEFMMLRNPVTGKIPENYRQIELEAARKIPEKGTLFNPILTGIDGADGEQTNNSYQNVGPNNVAGRSRTLGIDQRNMNILLTGGTTGGIFRSVNGGTSWTFVSGENDIHSATSIVQDPLHPDTWYCGTGEVFFPLSAASLATTVGYGIYKSTDNGASWSPLPSTQERSQNAFDNQFDIVNRLAVHPTTGALYAAVQNSIARSTDGGTTWTTVLGSVEGSLVTGMTDVLIASDGSKIFAAFTGNASRDLAGVWESTTGNSGTWTRIAGGPKGSTDSIPGWQPYPQWGRVVLALNSTNTQLFVLYKNGKDASGTTPQPEADLFRSNISSGTPSTYQWTNLSAWVPDEPNYNEAGIDPYTTQFYGYNMSIAVKPDDDNILFIGGTVLERVNLGTTTPAAKFHRVGGYGKGFFTDENKFFYPNHHPDIHGIYFFPGNSKQMFTVDDGGVHKTLDATADTVAWQSLDNGLQTIQFQYVNIHPDADADFIIGGAQDNGTVINLNPSTNLTDNQLTSGDGAACAITPFKKNGNTWTQKWYMTVVQGKLYRADVSITLSNSGPANLDITDFKEITPSGLSDQGQWLTLFVNDPDSSEHLYYNNKNRLFRTTSASTVTPNTWTEITGVRNTIPSSSDISAMALSKKRSGVKYLYLGTEAGKVYRLDNPNKASLGAAPVDITPTNMVAGSYVANICVNPRSPDTVMVVVSNYDNPNGAPDNVPNIFWTGNATSANPTWQVIDGALAPLSAQSCAIVVRTSGVEYYVGTSVGLYSTTSINGNSTSWLKEGNNMVMKNAIIRSLVNRQVDNTLVVGTHGNGAFMAVIGDAVVLGDDVATAVTPVTNDKNFIRSVYPTLSSDKTYYAIGNLFAIKRIKVEVFSSSGQKVWEVQTAYQNGSVDLSRLPAGQYILTITSDDGKYRHVQKVMRK